MRKILPLLLLASACTAVPPIEPVPSSAAEPGPSVALPRGATREPSGFVTIALVPPSPLPTTPPPMPTELDSFARSTVFGTQADKDRAWAQANGTEEFQREFQRLRELVAREEKGNFVTVRLVRDPGPIGEFAFTRDGPSTLAKYTVDPRFRGVTTGVDAESLAALEALWLERINQERAPIPLMGSSPGEGRLELTVGVEEAEFRQLAGRRGWDLADPRLDLRFPQPRPEPYADPAVAALVRAFPREYQEAGIRLTALGYGRVVLKDGCFRLGDERGRAGDKLVMFARGSQLALDDDGYLAIRTSDERRFYRVGEAAAWGGPNSVDEDSDDVRALRKACGNDAIVNVAAPQSERLFGLPDAMWVLDYAYTKDITYERAWARVIGCMERELANGRRSLEARDRCVQQYNGWDYRGADMPPPPGR